MSNTKPHDVAALIEAFEHSSAQEMRVVSGDFELHLSKTVDGLRQVVRGSSATQHAAPPSPTASTLASPPPPATNPATGGQQATASTSSSEAESRELPPGHVFVRAANLGTFYRSPKPGAPSYVEIGSKVRSDTEVCLIEVMKLFTPLIAGLNGTVREVLVKDGALVEFDQPLFLLQVEA